MAILLDVMSGKRPWLYILGTSLRPIRVFPECDLRIDRHKICKAFCEPVQMSCHICQFLLAAQISPVLCGRVDPRF